jgi:hypothetical protein
MFLKRGREGRKRSERGVGQIRSTEQVTWGVGEWDSADYLVLAAPSFHSLASVPHTHALCFRFPRPALVPSGHGISPLVLETEYPVVYRCCVATAAGASSGVGNVSGKFPGFLQLFVHVRKRKVFCPPRELIDNCLCSTIIRVKNLRRQEREGTAYWSACIVVGRLWLVVGAQAR